jgi:hypothetical protein
VERDKIAGLFDQIEFDTPLQAGIEHLGIGKIGGVAVSWARWNVFLVPLAGASGWDRFGAAVEAGDIDGGIRVIGDEAFDEFGGINEFYLILFF